MLKPVPCGLFPVVQSKLDGMQRRSLSLAPLFLQSSLISVLLPLPPVHLLLRTAVLLAQQRYHAILCPHNPTPQNFGAEPSDDSSFEGVLHVLNRYLFVDLDCHCMF